MKNALITGVSGGLGECLAREYLKRGCRVYGCSRRRTPSLERLLEEYPEGFFFYEMDVTGEASVKETAEVIGRDTLSLDVIVNAFGILPPNSARVLEEFGIDESIQVYNVNALGPLRVAKYFGHLLKKGEAKVLVNISSEAGSMATNNNYIIRYDYCMSKAGVNMQSVILQRYWRPEGIKVLAVHPGWMKTPMGGEKAPLDPQVAARGIVDLADRYSHDLEGGIYFDYDGTPRDW